MGRKLFITAVAAVLIIGSYEAFLRVAKPRSDVGQDQFATNRIRLENYVDRNERAVGVVVGSSLTARVPADAWPKDWQILSQAGGNALVGLEVVEQISARPQKILIEINTLDIAYRRDDVEAALSSVKRATRQILWLTRTASRPANLMVWTFRPRGGSGNEQPGPGFPIQLARQHRSYGREPGSQLKQNLHLTKKMVDRLRHRSVEIVFFEMPVDRSLIGLLRAQRIRDAVAAAFPPRFYCWRIVDDGRFWRTIDGIHLTSKSAREAAAAVASDCSGVSCTPRVGCH